jgi:hypothetical protein
MKTTWRGKREELAGEERVTLLVRRVVNFAPPNSAFLSHFRFLLTKSLEHSTVVTTRPFWPIRWIFISFPLHILWSVILSVSKESFFMARFRFMHLFVLPPLLLCLH